MAKLRPAFAKDGTVTAGNASGINDAAAAVVLASESFVNSNGFTPLGRLVGYGHAGRRAADHGHGPGARDAQACSTAPASRSTRSTCSR